MGGHRWTDERLALLRRLASEGMSGQQIADKLGITRNAVAGMAWRLNIERPKKPKIKKAKPPKPAINLQFAAKESVDGSNKITFRCYTILELSPGECRWPVGETADGLHTFCANRKDPAVSYCDYHAKIAYVKPRLWEKKIVSA
jgi:GcrA cell cycle regulator